MLPRSTLLAALVAGGLCACLEPEAWAQKRHALATAAWAVDPAFSPDSKWLAVLETVESGTDASLPAAMPPYKKVSRITIWDVESRKPTRALGAQDAGGNVASIRLAFSPDGAILACAEKTGSVRLWDTATWESFVLESPRPGASGDRVPPVCAMLAFSADSRVLAAGYQGEGRNPSNSIRLWDLHKREEMAALSLDGRPVGVTVLADGRVAAVVNLIGSARGKHSEIQLWQPTDNEPEVRHRIEEPHLTLAAFSPEGDLVAVAVRNEAAVWQTATGRNRKLGTFGDWNGSRSPDYRGGMTALAFSKDGQVLAAGGNANRVHTRVQLWRLSSSAGGLADLYLDHGEGYAVMDLAFSPDGQYLATVVHRWAGAGPTLHLWDLKQSAD